MIEPRLLTEHQARAYCATIDPRLVMPPLRLGRRLVWDRVALDRRLDELFGVARDPPAREAEAGSALERWMRGRSGGANGA